jgi:predicted AAA+ superfamily ATPase
MHYIRRLQAPQKSFFLLGPRSTGKSTWLKERYPQALRIDLLKNDTFFDLLGSPSLLRERVLAHDAKTTWIVIDEIQRLPLLLNEVHWLIQEYGYSFALSGSSARKLKRSQANLLAGRALVKHMYPLIAAEYQAAMTLNEALAYGTLPSIVAEPHTRIEQLEAYVGTYLREEIREEALTRNVQTFGRFLEIAALANGQVTNLSNIARDAAIPRATVTTYFEILIDTLLGYWLPAWQPRAKVKEVSHPKFYFFDCGVVRAIQKQLREDVGNEERGILFETMVFHELIAHISYHNIGGELFYWRTSDGIEIDFIWKRGKKIIAIEIKSSAKWRDEYNQSFKSLLSSKITPTACYGVYLGKEKFKKDFGLVLPWDDFLQMLYAGEILPG